MDLFDGKMSCPYCKAEIPTNARKCMFCGSEVGTTIYVPYSSPTFKETKICPDCKEIIKREAVICRYCKRKFSKDEVEEANLAAVKEYHEAIKEEEEKIQEVHKESVSEDNKQASLALLFAIVGFIIGIVISYALWGQFILSVCIFLTLIGGILPFVLSGFFKEW